MTTGHPRIAALRSEYHPWVDLVEIALEASLDPRWEELAGKVTPAASGIALAGATVPIDVRAGGALLERLLAAASDATRAAAQAARVEPARWLAAAIRQDRELLDGLGEAAPVAELAALPLLLACGRRFADRCAGWEEGACPVCGAWPVLGESRGLEKARRLRCARCAGDWGYPPLACPYCGNRDHERLRALVPERPAGQAGGEKRIDACDECHGFVKSVARLSAIPAEHLLFEDLATIELDLVAIERGYRRPPARLVPARVESR